MPGNQRIDGQATVKHWERCIGLIIAAHKEIPPKYTDADLVKFYRKVSAELSALPLLGVDKDVAMLFAQMHALWHSFGCSIENGIRHNSPMNIVKKSAVALGVGLVAAIAGQPRFAYRHVSSEVSQWYDGREEFFRLKKEMERMSEQLSEMRVTLTSRYGVELTRLS